MIALSLPALRTLALSGLEEAAPGQQECELQPLSQLTGLMDISITARRWFSPLTLASLSSLHQLASLELQLIKVNDDLYSFHRVFPHLSSLWGLSHLAYLSCIHVDTDPPFTGRLHLSLQDALLDVIDLTMVEDEEDRMITVLAGCLQLTSLHLPWANFMHGATERLAAELPQLTRLLVGSLWPQAPIPPCSWRELTLCGGSLQINGDFFHLPLEGLDRLHIDHLALPYIRNSDHADSFTSLMEQHGPLLAAKSQVADDEPGARLSFIHSLESAELAKVIAALAVLGGAVDALSFSHTQLEGSHVQALAAALPRLARLSLSDPGLISDDAWAFIGTLPSLKTFSVMRYSGGLQQQQATEPFNPQHVALLASSVTRPLTVTVAQSDAAVAALALKALQEAGNMGAGFITLLPREV